MNARAGPGLTYDILTTVPAGTWAQITGIDTLGDWYRVELDDLDQPAWIFRDYTKVAGGSLAGLIQIAVGGTPSPTAGQPTSSITVQLSLPQVGGVDLDVSWLDASACAQLYNLYHRSSTDSTTYISLEQAATASTANSKSLSFSTLSGSSFISAWCGTNGSRPRGSRSRDRSRCGRHLQFDDDQRRARRRAAERGRQLALSERSKLNSHLLSQ